MNTFKFYNDIIEDEKAFFSVINEDIKFSVKVVCGAYSPEALKRGDTYIDYNIPQHRCAYLYRYAPLHTELASKYFQQLLEERAFRDLKTLLNESKLNICCLGGGPGSDIVGILKALAKYSCFYGNIAKVTIIDICGGWRNSFKRVVKNVRLGKYNDIPSSFLDQNFYAELLYADLTEPLSTKVYKAVAEADILCMMKFVSAVINQENFKTALQELQVYMKPRSLTILIDNINVYTEVKEIFSRATLLTVIDLSRELYRLHIQINSAYREAYGCLPLNRTNVCILGWINGEVSVNLISSWPGKKNEEDHAIRISQSNIRAQQPLLKPEFESVNSGKTELHASFFFMENLKLVKKNSLFVSDSKIHNACRQLFDVADDSDETKYDRDSCFISCDSGSTGISDDDDFSKMSEKFDKSRNFFSSTANDWSLRKNKQTADVATQTQWRLGKNKQAADIATHTEFLKTNLKKETVVRGRFTTLPLLGYCYSAALRLLLVCRPWSIVFLPLLGYIIPLYFTYY